MKVFGLFRRSAAVVSLALSCMVAQSVSASTLSSVDWKTSGDGLLTLDSTTGLQWLDWSVTRGMTVDQAVASIKDFRSATNDEFSVFASDAGIPLFSAWIDSQAVAASVFINFVDTARIACPPHPSGYAMACGLIKGDDGLTSVINVSVLNGYGDAMIYPGFPVDYSSQSFGVALVRFPITTVPEPTSLALLSLAGVALGWSRRRRHIAAVK